jgi:hypothetical protein
MRILFDQGTPAPLRRDLVGLPPFFIRTFNVEHQIFNEDYRQKGRREEHGEVLECCSRIWRGS